MIGSDEKGRTIGVLALQGGWAAHMRALTDLGFTAVQIRTPADLEGVEGLVLPGGESTTHLKLIDRVGLAEPLDAFVGAGNPVLATCAGLILSAAAVHHPDQKSFGWLDVDVARNAWGRQVHSFTAAADTPEEGPFAGEEPLQMLFIRAPRIERIGAGVEVIAAYRGEPVMVRSGAIVGAAFHPELTPERRVHRLVFGDPGIR